MDDIKNSYVYSDFIRTDILQLVPDTGVLIGSVGCGSASTEQFLVKSGRVVHGVDISDKAIAVAKNHITSAKVIAGDVLMPFAENSLDGLILADVLEHMPKAWLRLEQFSKMVKPGGWILISVPNMRQLRIIYTFLFKGDWLESSTGIFDETHLQVMTHKRLERWANQSNLSLMKWQNSYFYRPQITVIYKFINLITFNYFRSFFDYQVLGLFIKK